MIELDRVLRPLQEAEPAIGKLETYESPAELEEALRATCHAVDRVLRMVLRGDASVADSVRLTAMSAEQMPTDAVLTELRRRERISLGLAGRVHEMRQALERAERGEVRASDADTAEDVVRCVREEVQRLARGEAPGRTLPPVMEDAVPAEEPVVVSRGARLDLRVIAGVAAAIVLVVAAIALFTRESDMEKGVAAFRDGRNGVAEQHFRTAIDDDGSNTTARLYLARILREQGRAEEAAQQLRAAVSADPRDDGVRRELGYLFVQLNRAPAAVEQFKQAVELKADEPLNWVGLIEALRRAGDASAAEWERRAPESAREMLRQREATRARTP